MLIDRAWRGALPLIVAALAAHAVVVGLTDWSNPAPLLTALAATLAFAAVVLGNALRSRDVTASWSEPQSVQLVAAGLAFAGILAGVWVIGRFAGNGAEFYCTPLVPWRIEIALFGSFAVGLLTAVPRSHKLAWAVYPLTMIAFLWIAPFYGFFSAPIFLGLSLNTPCSDRPISTVLLAALGMLVGGRMGAAVGGWLRPTLPLT
jgi:hypothetical protein